MTTFNAPRSSEEALHGWLPVATIADHLGINKSKVYNFLTRARRSRQMDWVQYTRYPFPDGPLLWLINTDGKVFQSYLQHWKSEGVVAAERLPQRNTSSQALLDGLALPPEEDDDDVNPMEVEYDEDDNDENPLFFLDELSPEEVALLHQEEIAVDTAPPPLLAASSTWPEHAPLAAAGRTPSRRPDGVGGPALLALLLLITLACLLKRAPRSSQKGRY